MNAESEPERPTRPESGLESSPTDEAAEQVLQGPSDPTNDVPAAQGTDPDSTSGQHPGEDPSVQRQDEPPLETSESVDVGVNDETLGSLQDHDHSTPEPKDRASSGRRIVCLVLPDEGGGPPPNWEDAQALAVWATASAAFHPAIVARFDGPPAFHALETAPPPEPNEVRLLPEPRVIDLLPEDRDALQEAQAVLIEASGDREALIARLRDRFEVGPDPARDAPEVEAESDRWVARFLTFGTVRWMIQELMSHLGHHDGLWDDQAGEGAILEAARAWVAGDWAGVEAGLNEAHAALIELRKRLHHEEPILLDLALLDASHSVADLQTMLDQSGPSAPVNLIATWRTLEHLVAADPTLPGQIRAGLQEGAVGFAGGSIDEVDEPFLPIESLIWQYRVGALRTSALLNLGRIRTWARRRFALMPMVPQLARRAGWSYALHLALDGGQFPIPHEAKQLWESPDHSNLEALCRPPLAADRPADLARLAHHLAEAIRDEMVPTVSLVHWPNQTCPWFEDLRRAMPRGLALAVPMTLDDYFEQTERPYETFRPTLDQYEPPYLSQAVSRGETRPISSRIDHLRIRAQLDTWLWLRSLVGVMPGLDAPEKLESPDQEHSSDGSPIERFEERLEGGSEADWNTLAADLDRQIPQWTQALAPALLGRPVPTEPWNSDENEGVDEGEPEGLTVDADGTTGPGEEGFLVINPSPMDRRAVVCLPIEPTEPLPEPGGPLLAIQGIDGQAWAVVEVAGHGFAWFGRSGGPSSGVEPRDVEASRAEVRAVRNRYLVAEVDDQTGGLRAVRRVDERQPRMAQQLVATGLFDVEGKPATTRMVRDGLVVEQSGPALARIQSTGTLLGPDDRPIARYVQRVGLWAERPTLDLEIQLSEIDPEWADRARHADPWAHLIGCRWAWSDPESDLRRLQCDSPWPTRTARPESSEGFEVRGPDGRSALLFGGLAHHQRQGLRMLDTLLVAGAETARRFELGVVLDDPDPGVMARERIQEALVVPTRGGPPALGPAGWLFRVEPRSVLVTRLEPIGANDSDDGPGLIVHLLETAGRPARTRLRLFLKPRAARQVDLRDQRIVDLTTDGDAVVLDLTPHELARVTVRLG